MDIDGLTNLPGYLDEDGQRDLLANSLCEAKVPPARGLKRNEKIPSYATRRSPRTNRSQSTNQLTKFSPPKAQ